MNEITIEHNVSPVKLDQMDVESWPIWTKEISKFDWTYDQNEVCYILEGDVVVTPEDGDSVAISEGDLVTFPKGMTCTWDIKAAVRKHYWLK